MTMLHRLLFFLASLLLIFPLKAQKMTPEAIASFRGQQVTGVTVTDRGRIFANFPRWRPGVKHSVVEVKDGQPKPFPDAQWNSWKLGDSISDQIFVAVQSVVAFENTLYVLDTRNPQFQGVVNPPRIFAFNLQTHSLSDVYILDENAYRENSYINDLRIDKKNRSIYCTDSGAPGLVIFDLKDGASRRILDNHPSTSAETDHLTIDGKRWEGTVHADGIALDTKQDLLYYHALSGYTLYALPTSVLKNSENEIVTAIRNVDQTAAPDGMIVDANGNLYFADLENHKIQYRTPAGQIKTLIEGDNVRWADTFSIYNGHLYYTNSRIHEAQGDISDMYFTIHKVPLPQR